MRHGLPPIDDALISLTEGQKSALATLAQCREPDERNAVRNWIQAWDRAMGRGDTLGMQERINRARQVWDGHLYQDGAGI